MGHPLPSLSTLGNTSSFVLLVCKLSHHSDFLLADVSGILTLRKVINHGNPRWRVSAQINGKRTQRFFNTKAEAQTWLTELRRKSPVEQFWQRLQINAKKLTGLLGAQQQWQMFALNGFGSVLRAEWRMRIYYGCTHLYVCICKARSSVCSTICFRPPFCRP